MSRKKDKKNKKRRPHLPGGELNLEEVAAIVERTWSTLSEEEHAKLKSAMDRLAFFTEEHKSKQTSMERLRRLLLGASSKTRTVLGEARSEATLTETTAAEGSRPPRAASRSWAQWRGRFYRGRRRAHPSSEPSGWADLSGVRDGGSLRAGTHHPASHVAERRVCGNSTPPPIRFSF